MKAEVIMALSADDLEFFLQVARQQLKGTRRNNRRAILVEIALIELELAERIAHQCTYTNSRH